MSCIIKYLRAIKDILYEQVKFSILPKSNTIKNFKLKERKKLLEKKQE